MARPVRVEVTPKYPNESIEKVIKRFLKKTKREKIIEGVIERKYFEKPSVKRRNKAKKRKKVLEKLNKANKEKRNSGREG